MRIALETIFLLVVVGILAVVVFDFTNGFHDASNMIATLVASRAMSPAQAASVVGVFTFLGPLLGGTAVADTLGNIVDLRNLAATDALCVVWSGLMGAIAWNLLTWKFAIPSSSSHALVGGLTGAVLAGATADHVVWGVQALSDGHVTRVTKVLITLIASPLLGLGVGFGLHRTMRFLLRAAKPSANRTLRRAQWFTAAALAFAHGTNDAQKGMGIIAMVLLLGGFLDEFRVPAWVIFICAASISLGTLFGGWRIVRTVGFEIYKLRPLHGFNAQMTTSAVVFGASIMGGPVSTTHVVTTAIMGIGAAERPRAVGWAKAREIALAWVVTLPATALLGAAAYWGLAGIRAIL